jgi:hypothetical protein
VSGSDPTPYSIPYSMPNESGLSIPLHVHTIAPVTLAAGTTYYVAADTLASTFCAS